MAIEMRNLQSVTRDVIELILIVWALPLVILALVLPLAAIDVLIHTILHSR